MSLYPVSAPVEILALGVFAWEIALGAVLLTRLPATDEFNPVARDRSSSPGDDRRRVRLCAHAFLRAALLGGFLISV